MAQDNSIPLLAFQGESPVDNFLSNYSKSQQQAQGNELHQRKIGMLDQAEEERKRQLVADALIAVPDGDAAAFEQVKQGLVSQGVIDPQTASQYDVSRLGQLKLMSQKWREMKAFEMEQQQAAQRGRLTEAQIGEVRARTSRVNADTRAQANPSPTQYQNLNVGGASTVAAPNPYANLSDDSARNRFYMQEAKANEKIRGDARAAAAMAQNKIAKVSEFRKMNKETGTGGVYDGPIFPGLFKSFARATDSNFSNMEAITAELAPQNRQPGSGATSDYDAQQFERATVGVDKPGPANKNIAVAIEQQAKRDIGYSKFVDWYFQTHKTNQGMDQAWQEYVDSNPIFDRSSPNNFEVNKQAASWDQWFGVRKPSNSAATAPTAGSATTDTGGFKVRKLR